VSIETVKPFTKGGRIVKRPGFPASECLLTN
jgi:hypothetical protein